MNNEPTVFVVDDDPAVRSIGCGAGGVAWFEGQGLRFGRGFSCRPRSNRTRMPRRRRANGGHERSELQEKLVEKADSIPVVIITGFADIPMAVRAMQAGVLDVS